MKYIYFPQLYLSLYLCIPQITKFTHPKALQLHSKPEDVLDLRASGWEDNKVVITPEFAGSAVLLRLYGFLFFLPIQASTGSANMSLMISWLPWGNQKIGSAKKAWWLRGKRWVTPGIWVSSVDVWSLEPFFMVASFAMPLRTSLYFETFWNHTNEVNCKSFHYCVNVTYEVNWSKMLELWMSVDPDLPR